MKRFAKISLALAATGVLAVALELLIASGDSSHYKKLVQILPSPIRVHYLNSVFDDPTEDCFGCRSRLLGSLRALKGDVQTHGEGYGFDHARLLPLLTDDRYTEPISIYACDLVIVRREERVYKAMLHHFREDTTGSIQYCIRSSLFRLKQLQPAEYVLTRAALLKIPELSAYVQAAP